MFARGFAQFARQSGNRLWTASARAFASGTRSTAARWTVAASTAFAVASFPQLQVHAEKAGVDYNEVRKTIAAMLEAPNYDDGSLGPIFIRLAWHASGTFDCRDGTGGSSGATMRFKPESEHGANAGLNIARDLLEKVKAQYPGISYADLWTLAGVVAVEEMGGPKIKWKPGRSDAVDGKTCPADGRLPDAAQGAQHLRQVFYKMGFDDREIVALAGAHCFGRCHTNRSGYHGPWTRAPTTFSNLFYKELLDNKWTQKQWQGPKQFQDPTGDLMMTPADMSIIEDPTFRKYAELYAKDEKVFEKDFAKAYSKLLSLGVSDKKKKKDNLAFPALLAGVVGVAAVSRLH